MRILEERRMDKNFPTVPVHKPKLSVAIDYATTTGLTKMVEKMLDMTLDGEHRAPDLLHTPDGVKAKEALKVILTDLFAAAGIND